MTLATVNPTTGEPMRSFPEFTEQNLPVILEKAHQAFLDWRKTSFPERAGRITAVASRLDSHAAEYAKLMAEEMGKPVRQGRAEIEKCGWLCEYYAQNAQRLLKDEEVNTNATRSYICFEPIGIVLGIMPWNFPFWQVFRAAIPCLAAGNAFIFKHASNVPGCAETLENIFESAGLPEGLFRNLFVEHELIPKIIEDPRVQGVTLTGSSGAGRAIASKAGTHLKKTVLELGGSDPYIIFEDADLEAAAKTCTEARLINAGQSCIAAKRFIVLDTIKEKFEKLLVQEMKKLRMGDPLEEQTDVGPLARQDLRAGLHEQVEKSVAMGARLLLGGQIPEGKGVFYPPTVLTDVKKGMPAFDEETFGPVAAVISARDESDALRLANSTNFGLGAALFTKNETRGERLLRNAVMAGSCFLNAAVKSDPRLPFGGIKESGYGRELGSFGIKEFMNVKTIYIK